MLRIRLQRTGRRNQAHYRIVIADKQAPIKGKFIEKVGWYNPHTKAVGLTKDRILYWLSSGAQPSNTTAKLLKKQHIEHKLVTVAVKPPRKPKSSTASEKTRVPSEVKSPRKTTELLSQD